MRCRTNRTLSLPSLGSQSSVGEGWTGKEIQICIVTALVEAGADSDVNVSSPDGCGLP